MPTPGTTNFPASLDTDSTLLVQVNDCSSLLATTISNSATSLDVVSGTLFPSAGVIRLEDEFLIYTGKSTNTLTGLTRGAFSSVAAAHTAGVSVKMTLMAAYHNAVKDAVVAVETKVGSGSSTPAVSKLLRGTGSGTSVWADDVVVFILAASDESTALTTGTSKVTFRAPFAFTLTGVRGALGTPQTSGSIFTVDINKNGTTVISTKLTIDNTEKTSVTAATPAVISVSAFADDDEIEIDIDQVGDGTAKGLKITLSTVRT